jgi:hypothetical protein
MNKSTKTMRARRTKAQGKDSPTASRARKSRAKAANSHERRPTFEIWGTIAPPDRFSDGRPSVCLWGTQETAMGGCDPDEKVCLVRVEVLEVLDEEESGYW